MIGVVARILLRYLAAATAAVVEGWYWLAKRFGWAT